MPTALKNGGTETTIIEWYQQHESASLEDHHHTLLTHIEEELLHDWVILAYQHFEPVGAEQIIAKAKEIMRTQRGEEHAGIETLTQQHLTCMHMCISPYGINIIIFSSTYVLLYVGAMKHWYTSFRMRHPDLSQRLSQQTEKQRVDAQRDTASISHYFSILKQFQHLPAAQIYAADETGLDGDSARQKKVLIPKGAARAHTRGKSYAEHTYILSACCADGTSLPPAFVFKGDPKKIDRLIVSQLPTGARYVQQRKGYFLKTHFSMQQQLVLCYLLSMALNLTSI